EAPNGWAYVSPGGFASSPKDANAGPTCCLRSCINNDDYREFERSLGERMPAQVFKKNCLGYTMIGVAKSPKGIRSDVQSTRHQAVRSMANQRPSDLPPIGRVAEDHLATAASATVSSRHRRRSKKFSNDEEVMLSTEGKGSGVPAGLPVLERQTWPEGVGEEAAGTEAGSGGGGGGGRSPSRGCRTWRWSRQACQRRRQRLGEKARRASCRTPASVSSIAHDKREQTTEGEFKPHKLDLLDEVWPFDSRQHGLLFEHLKEQEKEDLKAPRELAEQRPVLTFLLLPRAAASQWQQSRRQPLSERVQALPAAARIDSNRTGSQRSDCKQSVLLQGKTNIDSVVESVKDSQMDMPSGASSVVRQAQGANRGGSEAGGQATVTGSTAGGAAKKGRPKARLRQLKPPAAKNGRKDGKGGGKDGKGGDKKGAAGDPSVASRPESATFDERKAHWVLRVISDASQSERDRGAQGQRSEPTSSRA
uniref:CW-type domain-containing protein n=1 Tax=Macrostomum lignano TaxID=282301 RepID=A0A1I8JR22_9PLAT